MAGQRKTLGSLVGTTDMAPPPPTTSPDRDARSNRPAKIGRPAEQETPAQPPASSGMTMRSWYMPKGSADQLAALVDDIHFATRLPKHLIMGAAVNVFERRRGEIEAEARSVAGNG